MPFEINISGGITIRTEDPLLAEQVEVLLASGATPGEIGDFVAAWEKKNITPAGKPVASGPGAKKPEPEVKKKQDDVVQKSAVESKKIIETPAPSRLQLNHLVFQIPPEQINIQHEIKNVSMGVLRASSTQKVRTGHGMIQVTIPLVFTTRAAVNTELVPLLHMLRKTPFCWTENEYLRKMLSPGNKTDAMMLSCASVTVQSVPNLPTTLNAVLQFFWFNYKPYINELYYRKRFLMDPSAIPDLTGPEGFQPTPQHGLNVNRYNYDLAYAGTVDGTFAPRGTLQEHIADTLKGRDESLDSTYTKSEQVILYDQMQEKVRDPFYSKSWGEFIKGYTQNQLTRYEYGPSIAPDKYFRMMWKQFKGFPSGAPEGTGEWIEEDPIYKVFSRLFQFNADPEFVPVHAAVQFVSRIANLPLLSQQLPTQQYLGPADRELTLTFNVTERGKGLLQLFRSYIEAFENQVVDYRHLAQHQHMEIQTPFAKMAGFPQGVFGSMVVPENIDIQTTPGNPGNSVVRVTFSEFNPSLYKEPVNTADKEYAIFTAFMQSLFNKLSGGRPRDIIYPFSPKIPEDLLAKTLGVLDLAARELTDLEAGIEIRMLLSKKEAEKRGQTVLFDAAQEILEITQARPTIFAIATDKQVYGLKSIAEIDPYWSGDVKLFDKLNKHSESMNHQIREVCRKWLEGDLSNVFPFLALEFAEVNHDVEACYPDMQLPPHPATKRVVDTEADFYLVDSVLAQQADDRIQLFVRGDLKAGVQKNMRQNKQTALDEDSDRPVEITEEESIVYEQKSPTDMDNLPGIDPKWGIGGNLESQEIKALPKDKLVHNITDDDIINAGINEIKHHAQLGFRKAFPTFRLYFLKEGRDQVDYTNFYAVKSGFAVKEIRLVRSRKIPADMCVIDMVNLDGFMETDYVTDIRREALHTKQSRYEPGTRQLFFKHDDLIKNQLMIHNNMFETNISYGIVKKIVEGALKDPLPGQYGPMGITIRHGELADGKHYSPDQLSDPITNIRIGTFLLCLEAFKNKELITEPRFTEIVTSSFRFPEVSGQIGRAALQDIEKNGVVTDDWYIHVRNEEVAEFSRGIREQESSESAARTRLHDEKIKAGEEELETLEASVKSLS